MYENINVCTHKDSHTQAVKINSKERDRGIQGKIKRYIGKKMYIYVYIYTYI